VVAPHIWQVGGVFYPGNAEIVVSSFSRSPFEDIDRILSRFWCREFYQLVAVVPTGGLCTNYVVVVRVPNRQVKVGSKIISKAMSFIRTVNLRKSRYSHPHTFTP
jgi:hypothetical protein